MATQTAIEVEGLSKRYRLGENLGGYTTLRETLASPSGAGASRRDDPDELWALRDVSFAVAAGRGARRHRAERGGQDDAAEGPRADHASRRSGVSRTRGRAGALLDVGTGFHPELTGRENIYLNAAILGMSRRDVDRRFDEIVDFAGLERFLDTPLKRYSWGMYLRLAFAVAAHVEPDIVIVDEVLGDRRRAVPRRSASRRCPSSGSEGRTVVFVSHDLGSITQLCRRAIWLDARSRSRRTGRARRSSSATSAASIGDVPRADFAPDPTQRVQVLAAEVTDEDGTPLDHPERGQPLTLARPVRRPRAAAGRRRRALGPGPARDPRRSTRSGVSTATTCSRSTIAPAEIDVALTRSADPPRRRLPPRRLDRLELRLVPRAGGAALPRVAAGRGPRRRARARPHRAASRRAGRSSARIAR